MDSRNDMATGLVEFFNNMKGWGIIKGEKTEESFFVHHENIVDKRFFPENGPQKFKKLTKGQKVQFKITDPIAEDEPGKPKKHRMAIDVEILADG